MDWIVQNLWLIPALPLLAAGLSALLKQRQRRLAASLAIGSMVVRAGSFAARRSSTRLSIRGHGAAARQVVNFFWFQFGDPQMCGTALRLGWVLDPLTAVMLVMVTLVGLLIFIYSVGYMAHDENFTRFFCFLSLFAAAMLGLVIANSLLLLFICWELVGLTSYLLIGFWYHKPSAAAAAKKAFITTRIGDLAFLLGMVWLYSRNRHAAVLRQRQRLPGTIRARQAGRANHEPRHGGLDGHRAADLLRRDRQIGPGAAARLAAGRDGRPDARQRAHPRGDDGGGGRVPGGAGVSVDGCASRGRWRR